MTPCVFFIRRITLKNFLSNAKRIKNKQRSAWTSSYSILKMLLCVGVYEILPIDYFKIFYLYLALTKISTVQKSTEFFTDEVIFFL